MYKGCKKNQQFSGVYVVRSGRMLDRIRSRWPPDDGLWPARPVRSRAQVVLGEQWRAVRTIWHLSGRGRATRQSLIRFSRVAPGKKAAARRDRRCTGRKTFSVLRVLRL